MFRLSRWQPRHLLIAWVSYWLLLIVVLVAPAASSLWGATRPDAKGSFSVSVGDLVKLTVSQNNATTWEGSIQGMTLLLLAAIPPLILWAIWLWAQNRRSSDPALLGDTVSAIETGEREALRERRDLKE